MHNRLRKLIAKSIRYYDKVKTMDIRKLMTIMAALLMFGASVMTAQNNSRSISGLVVDQAGEPVIGAGVMVKNTTTGAVTDIDGMFRLDNVGTGTVIEVSALGYQNAEFTVAPPL